MKSITWPAAYPLGGKRYRGCIQKNARTIWECRHKHNTDDAAQACAARRLKS